MIPTVAVEWPLLVAAGMAGVAHCLGMCGPFALAIGAGTRDWRANLRRQAAYSLGRVFTYAVLGAAAGFVAARFAGSLPTWANVPAALAITAGLLLVWQGLLATGLIRRRGVAAGGACPGGAALRGLLAARGCGEVFLAGLFTGLLPCGLLYGMLAYAASCRDVLSGMVAMAAFGTGTMPGMIAAGLGGSILGVAGRRRLHVVAAWCLVATGVVSIVRGASFVTLPGAEPAGCPFCHAAGEAGGVSQDP
ncbi:MAG: sulfite exporter TauE/SafE family protein [Pirellulales bacterium]